MRVLPCIGFPSVCVYAHIDALLLSQISPSRQISPWSWVDHQGFLPVDYVWFAMARRFKSVMVAKSKVLLAKRTTQVESLRHSALTGHRHRRKRKIRINTSIDWCVKSTNNQGLDIPLLVGQLLSSYSVLIRPKRRIERHSYSDSRYHWLHWSLMSCVIRWHLPLSWILACKHEVLFFSLRKKKKREDKQKQCDKINVKSGKHCTAQQLIFSYITFGRCRYIFKN